MNGPQNLIEVDQSLDPIFKWPGGKRRLLSTIKPFFSTASKRLIEPFCGGSALFFSLRPHRAVLADSNLELINAYTQLRDQFDFVTKGLKKLENSESAYYRIRAENPRDPIDRAIRFIYLIQLSFNGIYRENLKGEFNVPYGYKTWASICNEKKLRDASLALQNTELLAQSYKDTMSIAGRSDHVYVDPPYTVSHNNNGFIKYNQTLFSWEDQLRLAEACEQARMRGCLVVVSNADHDDIRSIYSNFEYKQLDRFCSISGQIGGRKRVTEALFIGRPEK